MAKAAKQTNSKTTKAKTSPENVEDAVVIEETPAPEAEKAPAEAKTVAGEGDTPETAEAPAEAERLAAMEPETPKTDAKQTTADDGPPPAAPVVVEKRRGGFGAFLGLVIGGALAAVIGFGAARYVVPEGWPFPGTEPEVDPLVAVVEGQAGEISALADRLAALEADTTAEDALGALQGEIAAFSDSLTARFDALSGRLEVIEARLDAVEKLAPEGSEAAAAAAAAYDRELAALREMFAGELAALEAQQADAAELEAAAAEAAQAAAGRAALTKVATALDTGQPFGPALAELTEATGIAVPGALSALADSGAPTLGALQEDFPAAARAAIDAATKAAVEDGSMGRVTAFFRTQLGTRSLEPREGDDADAVLSRAEAALKAGDISGALVEIEALPEAAAPEMAGWVERAKTRQAALEANAALARELNAQ